MTPDQLTENDKALIRANSKTIMRRNIFVHKIHQVPKSNIAALHFDGQVLADMLTMHEQFKDPQRNG